MQRVLFNTTIFGPIHSRRLGESLGINLSPTDGKVCSFDCLYCEAGFNAQGSGSTGLPSRNEVYSLLRESLSLLKAQSAELNVITFSGNGEPTLHPDFEEIVNDVIALRNEFYPNVKISVLTNSTRLDSEAVCRALNRVDNNILKLDSAIESTFRKLDRPTSTKTTVKQIIDNLKQFSDTGIIQTMILRGNGIDNTTTEEINALCDAYKAIRPREIMIYSIDRKTPDPSLTKVSREELQAIAQLINSKTNIPVSIA